MNNGFNLRNYAATKLKYLRETNNMTQDDLAEQISKRIDKEVKRQTVSLYENGERGMNQDILFALSDIFDVSINVFFPETTNKMKHDDFFDGRKLYLKKRKILREIEAKYNRIMNYFERSRMQYEYWLKHTI